MYISESAVLWAVEQLKVSTHPFLGITFLACKKHELPVGKTTSVRLDALTRDHLQEHHRLDPDSRYFFQPFKSQKNWVADNYASTGLQGVNTRTFWTVFKHERGKPEWGFRDDYVHRVRARIQMAGYRKTPLPAIAIWLAKNQEWLEGTSVEALVEDFIWRYNITRSEQQALFSPRLRLVCLRHYSNRAPPTFSPCPTTSNRPPTLTNRREHSWPLRQGESALPTTSGSTSASD